MSHRTLRNAIDSWANEAKPSQRHGDNTGLALRDGAGQRAWVYVFFNRPFPLGVTIDTAPLRLYTRGAWGITPRLTVKQITERWRQKRLNWSNKPGVTGAGIPLSQPSNADGDMWEWEIAPILQAVSDSTEGGDWWGIRIETDDTTALRRFYASDAAKAKFRPTLDITWGSAPHAPTDLSPSGGRSVSVASPVLRCDFTDEVGATSMKAIQVQIDPNGDFTAPAWDSGEVLSTVPELDLATTTYPGLAEAATTNWQVRVQDASDRWSKYSDPDSFRRDAKGTLAITSPGAAPNDVVYDWTPEFIAQLTGATLTHWQFILTTTDDVTTILDDTGRQLATDPSTFSHTPDHGILDDPTVRYRLVARAWDDKLRAPTPGDPPYVETVTTFSLSTDATVTPVTNLVATPLTPQPGMKFTFSRPVGAPDAFAVTRDGKLIDTGLDPADLLVAGSDYAYVDTHAGPRKDHTWSVEAIVNGRRSDPNPSVTGRTKVAGVWLSDPERDLHVIITGKNPVTWGMGEASAFLTPLGADEGLLVTQALRGYESKVQGLLVDCFGVTAQEWRDRLLDIRSRPGRTLVLTTGDGSFKVVANNIVAAAGSDIPGAKDASFTFYQTGKSKYRVRL